MMLHPGVSDQANSINPVIHAWRVANQKAAKSRMQMARSTKDPLGLIDKDFYNLCTSLNWLAEQDDQGSADLVIGYLVTLFPFLYQKRHHRELDKWCVAGLRACKITGRSPADVFLMKSETQFALGRWKDAQAAVEQALMDSTNHDPMINAQANFILGRIQIERGEYKSALVTLSKAEVLFTRLGNTGKIIEVRSEIGAYYLNRRDLNKALELFLTINELHRSTNTSHSRDHTQMMLGVVYRQQRNFDKAIEYLFPFYEQGKVRLDQAITATAAYHLAWVYLEQGNLAKARKMCGEAIAGYQEHRDTRGLSDAYEQLAAILIDEQELNVAIEYLDRSMTIREQIGNRPGLVSSLRRLALVRMLRREYWGMLSLIGTILLNYLQMNMLSRQRIFRLVQDAMIGVSRAIFYGDRSQTYQEHQNRSLMEQFFAAMLGANKKDKK